MLLTSYRSNLNSFASWRDEMHNFRVRVEKLDYDDNFTSHHTKKSNFFSETLSLYNTLSIRTSFRHGLNPMATQHALHASGCNRFEHPAWLRDPGIKNSCVWLFVRKIQCSSVARHDSCHVAAWVEKEIRNLRHRGDTAMIMFWGCKI
jgi:hypothetical protein